MHILLITEFYPTSERVDIRGGVELRTFIVSRMLTTQYKVTVVAQREPGTQADAKVGAVRVIRPGPVCNYRQGGGLINRLRFALVAKRTILAESPDLVIAENFGGYVIALMMSSAWHQKVILTYHDVWIGEWIKNVGLVMGMIGEVVERLVLRTKWKHFIVNSEVTKNKLIARGVNGNQITVVYTGIDLEEINGIQPEIFDQPTIVAVARLVKYKRLDDLLSAMKRVHHILPEIKLVIIGSGPKQKELKNITAQLGINECVEWRGFVPDYHHVLAAIKGATIFSLPSEVEGFGLVTLEALACGTPYVSSDILPTREVTADGLGGVLYPVGDVLALSSELVKLLTDKKRQELLSAQGQQRALSFSWDRISQQILKLIERCYFEINHLDEINSV